tara:strand:- start:27 stop:1169 length:1143 start_codon:yes stop_codon:yes gene_type:complete
MFLRILFCLLMHLLLVHCGSKQMSPQSSLDSAENHYKLGLNRFENGDLRAAQSEFERGRALDPDYPGIYVGSALVAMGQQDFWRARKDVEKAIHKNGDFIDAYIALGRIVSEEGVQRNYPTKEWLKEALSAYKKAKSREPDNPAIYYREGLTYLQALNLPLARASLTRVLEINRGDWVTKAMLEIDKIQRIERAAPGSQAGLKIGLVEDLNRAELAVLLVEELKLPELVAKRGGREKLIGPQLNGGDARPLMPDDVIHSWARYWIEEVLYIGIQGLEINTDNAFLPEEPVTRANYALVNQGILILLTGDTSLATRYFGEPSRFPDVRSDSFTYNAIALSTERGFMSADRLTGCYRPHESVSGAEALLIIRELQNAFRMEF